MKVLVDTCVWSKALRYKASDKDITKKINEIIINGALVIIGPIRQEILSGIAEAAQFNKLRDRLSPFEDVPLKSEHFLKAAEFCNICRKKGIQGSSIDFLICAVASLEKFIIFTTDKDFERYAEYLPIKLL